MTSPVTEIELPWSSAYECASLDAPSAADCGIALLDGGAVDPSTGAPGRGIYANEPIAVIEQFAGSSAEFRVGDRVVDRDENGWRLWRRVHGRLPSLTQAEADKRDAPATSGSSFGPGWIGYVGYEMGAQLERLQRRDSIDMGLPILRLALYDRVILLDHRQCRAFTCFAPGVRECLSLPRIREPNGATRWTAKDELERRSARLGFAREGEIIPAAAYFETTRRAFESSVRRALEYIAAGDVYQVNLSHRIRLDHVSAPGVTHAALRCHNAAAYASLLNWRDRETGVPQAVISASPELFLELRGGIVRTRPIKGTRPRTGDATLDSIRRRDLLDSEKEAAELAMIVDLHRNDLGRVCEIGSVRVASERLIEEHPTVFHTVSEITGRLRSATASASAHFAVTAAALDPLQQSKIQNPKPKIAPTDALDLLMACFPAGSVTGAPKFRAMQIIHELETAPRGVYTGAIGWLGLNGDMSFNVAIRTLQQHGDTAWLHVGSGIVADSDPSAEYDETLAKARGIIEAVSRVGASPATAPAQRM